MITRKRIIVLLILVLVALIAAWSRLHHVNESDHEPQRIPVPEHPAFRKHPGGGD